MGSSSRSSSTRFERGFLAEATVMPPHRPASDLWDRPEWATVRTLRGDPVVTAAMRSLEEVVRPAWALTGLTLRPTAAPVKRLRLQRVRDLDDLRLDDVGSFGADEVSLEIEVDSYPPAIAGVVTLSRGPSGRYDHVVVEVSRVTVLHSLLAPLRRQEVADLTLVGPPDTLGRLAAAAAGCAGHVTTRSAG